jgi:tetratricopeptide (TPR) repeat protein
MQKLFPASALFACALLLAACSNNPPAPASNQNANAAANSAPSGGTNTSGPGVVSSHGGGGGAAAPAASDGGSDRSLADTAELDARIKKAADKAKAPGATAADKKAAADAYLARGNVYYSAGQPRLYKYALADFRQVLKYDPENEEAKGKVDTIVSIYQSMGRPVPEVSPEP